MVYVLMLLSMLLAWSLLLPKAELHDFNVKLTLPLRGVLAVLIVACHVAASFNPPAFEGLEVCHIFFINVGKPVVSVFFLITGYGLAKSFEKRGNAYLDGFMKKRLSSMLPELILVSAFVMAMGMTFGECTFMYYAERYMRGVAAIGESWFIYAVIAVYTVFYLSHLLCSGNNTLSGILFTLCILGLIYLPYKLEWPNYWYLSTISVAIGYWLAVYEKKLERVLFNPISIIFIIAIGVISLIMCHKIPFSILIVNALCSLAAYICVRRYGFPQTSILIFLGGISLNVYLLHPIVILFVYKAGLDGSFAMAVIFVMSVVGAFALKHCRCYVEAKLSTISRKHVLG